MTQFMRNNNTEKKSKRDPSKLVSRNARIEADQEVVDLPFMTEPQQGAARFEDCIAILYGPSGVGKTRLCSEIPGHYIIDAENKSQWNRRRATYVPNWPSFKAFIEQMERAPELVATVKMWCIDTIDVLVTKAMSTICAEWELLDLSEEGFSRAWQELVQEVVFQILRLRQLGPGIVMVSHEREVEIKHRFIKLDHTRMDVSKSVFNALSFISDLTLHMTYEVEGTLPGDRTAKRCLVTRGNETADAKNCTRANLPDSLPFHTEREAVQKILDAFGEPIEGERREPAKTRKKVVKKVVRKTNL